MINEYLDPEQSYTLIETEDVDHCLAILGDLPPGEGVIYIRENCCRIYVKGTIKEVRAMVSRSLRDSAKFLDADGI